MGKITKLTKLEINLITTDNAWIKGFYEEFCAKMDIEISRCIKFLEKKIDGNTAEVIALIIYNNRFNELKDILFEKVSLQMIFERELLLYNFTQFEIHQKRMELKKELDDLRKKQKECLLEMFESSKID